MCISWSFVDYFSKWVEVSSVREATAHVATSKLLSEVFARHGAPAYLISDWGSPLVSELFKHVLTTLGSEHRLMTAYHPQTNATEWVNRSLKPAIRAYVGKKHTAWDCYLPQIVFAMKALAIVHLCSCTDVNWILPLTLSLSQTVMEWIKWLFLTLRAWGLRAERRMIMLVLFWPEAMPKLRSTTTRDVNLFLTLWMSW